MDWVDPCDGLGLLHGFNVEVDNDCLLVTAHNHAFQWLLRKGIYFLMRHVGQNIMKSPGAASAVYCKCSPQRMRARPLTT